MLRSTLLAIAMVALGGCSTPAEVSCLAGESLCHGACIASGTVCPGAAPNLAMGTCAMPNATAGTPCNDNGGIVCDGFGTCVPGCSSPPDCPTTTTMCAANVCNPMVHLCMLIDAPAGVVCSDSGGTVCNGNGTCVPSGAPGMACSLDSQCASGQCGTSGSGSHCCAQSCPTGTCGATDCDASGACVFMPMGVPCGAGMCNGAGTCVLPCGQSMYKCAFVTNQVHDGNLGGSAGADATCAAAASAAGVAGTFAAWLSVTGSDANTHIGASTQPYQLLDGTAVAANSATFSSGALLGPITRDENGNLILPGDVWTNTNLDGTLNAAGACGDFMSNSHASAPVPIVGSSGAADPTWTANQTIFCDATARLYCLEQ